MTRRDAVFVFPTLYFHVYPKIYKGNTTELSIQLCDPRFNPSKLVQGMVVAWRICEIIGVRSTLYRELFYSRFIHSLLHFLSFFSNPSIHYKVKKKWNYKNIDNNYQVIIYHRHLWYYLKITRYINTIRYWRRNGCVYLVVILINWWKINDATVVSGIIQILCRWDIINREINNSHFY